MLQGSERRYSFYLEILRFSDLMIKETQMKSGEIKSGTKYLLATSLVAVKITIVHLLQ